MRLSERDVLLLVLAVAAGSADGWSYFGLGHSFVANMTGNTILLGIAMFLHGDMLHPLISLVCYALGVALAAFLMRNVREGSDWAHAVSKTLALEAALLVGAAIGWALTGHNAPRRDLLLGCVALAIGIQSGAMLQLRIPGIVTTYITGTWTNLMSGLTRFISREEYQPRREKMQYEERLMLQAWILCVYLLSAMATGLLFRYSRLAVGALPALSVLSVAMYGLAHKPSTEA